MGRQQSFDKGFRVQFSIFSEIKAYKSVAYKIKSVYPHFGVVKHNHNHNFFFISMDLVLRDLIQLLGNCRIFLFRMISVSYTIVLRCRTAVVYCSTVFAWKKIFCQITQIKYKQTLIYRSIYFSISITLLIICTIFVGFSGFRIKHIPCIMKIIHGWQYCKMKVTRILKMRITSVK